MGGRRGSPQYAVNLYLDGKDCLVVGAGPVAAGKIEGLLTCGAKVTVVAPRGCGAVEGWAADGRVEWHRRAYEASDLDRAFLVVTATDDRDVNHRVYLDAEARGVLVNSADDPDNCRFTLPSLVRRGDLTVAVSTRGRSPAMAAHLRRRLGALIGPEYETALELLATVRDELRQKGVATEPLGRTWAALLDDGPILAMAREGKVREARALLLSALEQAAGVPG